MRTPSPSSYASVNVASSGNKRTRSVSGLPGTTTWASPSIGPRATHGSKSPCRSPRASGDRPRLGGGFRRGPVQRPASRRHERRRRASMRGRPFDRRCEARPRWLGLCSLLKKEPRSSNRSVNHGEDTGSWLTSWQNTCGSKCGRTGLPSTGSAVNWSLDPQHQRVCLIGAVELLHKVVHSIGPSRMKFRDLAPSVDDGCMIAPARVLADHRERSIPLSSP